MQRPPARSMRLLGKILISLASFILGRLLCQAETERRRGGEKLDVVLLCSSSAATKTADSREKYKVLWIFGRQVKADDKKKKRDNHKHRGKQKE